MEVPDIPDLPLCVCLCACVPVCLCVWAELGELGETSLEKKAALDIPYDS